MRKKIDVIVKYFYPIAAGIETNVLETYSILAMKGWDVTIHTSRDTYLEKDILPKEEIIRGLKVKRYSYHWYSFLPQVGWDGEGLVCLHNFNVVPHFFIMAYSLMRKVLGKKKYALVLTPHGGFNPEWSIFSKPVAFVKKLYHYTLGTLLINLVVDKMRAVSEWERQEIVKKGVHSNKVVTISNGLESVAYMDIDKLASAYIKKKVKSFGRYIIQIGRIYSIKNYETTIKALVRVPNDLKYIIVGPVQDDDGYFKSLKNLIKKLKLGKRVIFMGVIRGIDKYYLIKYAQMMVHMAKWESFCNVVHEGMSQGLPCIVADNTALPLLIKDKVNGFCVETYNDKTVSEKINYILENYDSPEIQKIRERNRKFGLEESWTNVALKMDKLYLFLSKYYEK